MIELVVVIVAGLLILGITIEVFKILERREVERYESSSKARLLDELRRR